MDIPAKLVMELRRLTGAGMMDCKKALIEAGGDLDKARDHLRAKGLKDAGKKAGRATSEGLMGTYVHHNRKLAAMVEVLCETDFVARNEDFIELARQLAMHVAAANPAPRYLTRDEVPAADVEREKAIFLEQVKDKPEQIRAKIVEGKLNSFFAESVLLEQPYSMDTSKGSVSDVLNQAKSKAGFGENIILRRFMRWEISDDIPLPGGDDTSDE